MFRLGEGYFMHMKSFDFEAFAAVFFGRCQICFIKGARTYLIALHLLTNISRSKNNQTMEVGQLIEDNMRKFFPEKLHTRCGGDNIPRPFSKNQN